MTLKSAQPKNRFAWLYDPNTRANAVWDEVLLSHDGAKLVASLGAIVPGWVLAFPEQPVLNLSQATPAERTAVLEASQLAVTKVRHLGPRVYHFEHGASSRNTVMGCGLDIAHLHTVPLRDDFLEFVMRTCSQEVLWTREPLNEELWNNLPDEYLVVWEHGSSDALVGQLVARTSQFFRKAIAAMQGRPEDWDYAAHGFVENVLLTRSVFVSR